jgi:hypothetical protein
LESRVSSEAVRAAVFLFLADAGISRVESDDLRARIFAAANAAAVGDAPSVRRCVLSFLISSLGVRPDLFEKVAAYVSDKDEASFEKVAAGGGCWGLTLRQAVKALSESPPDRHFASLRFIDAFDSTPSVRRRANLLRALALFIDQPPALTKLTDALTDPSEAVQVEAVRLLRAAVMRDPSFGHSVVPRFASLLRSS